jgi:hypothetical protein
MNARSSQFDLKAGAKQQKDTGNDPRFNHSLHIRSVIPKAMRLAGAARQMNQLRMAGEAACTV